MTMTNPATLQMTVLRALMQKRRWDEYKNVVSEEVITDSTARAVYAHLAHLHGASTSDVAPVSLRLRIEASYPEGQERARELCSYVDSLSEIEVPEPNALRDCVQQYVQRELLYKAARKIAAGMNTGDLDVAEVGELVDRAREVGDSVDTDLVNATNAPLPGVVDDRPGITPLGLSPALDRALGGGVAAGELLVFVAPPARGKTSLLCACGAAAASAGRKVLHITLEISAMRVLRRYDAAWSRLSRAEMLDRPALVDAARQRVREAGGAVHVKDWSYKETGCTPSDIKSLVRQVRSAQSDIDIVIVDYLELMVPDRNQQWSRREVRHVLGQQIKELRAVAVALQCPVLSAWQINREGSRLDTIDMTHLSECWDANKHADIVLALNQSEAEAQTKNMRIGVLKQRDSTARPQVHVKADLDRCTVLPDDRFDSDEVVQAGVTS